MYGDALAANCDFEASRREYNVAARLAPSNAAIAQRVRSKAHLAWLETCEHESETPTASLVGFGVGALLGAIGGLRAANDVCRRPDKETECIVFLTVLGAGAWGGIGALIGSAIELPRGDAPSISRLRIEVDSTKVGIRYVASFE